MGEGGHAQASMMPMLFESWMSPVQRPRIAFGAHSDTYVGTSADTMPTPHPPRKRPKSAHRRRQSSPQAPEVLVYAQRTLSPVSLPMPIPTIDWMSEPMTKMMPDAISDGFRPKRLAR